MTTITVTTVAGARGHVGFDQRAHRLLPRWNLGVAVLVVVVLVVLVHITYIFVILLESLAGAGRNPILFVLVNTGNRSRGTGWTSFPGRTFPTITAAATTTAATTRTRIALFPSGFFYASGSRGAIGNFCGRSLIHVEVVNPRHHVFVLQIEIKFAWPRLFPPRRAVISARSGGALVAAASILTTGLFAARRRDIATRRRSFFAASFRPAALFAPLAAAPSALVAAAPIASALSAALFIPLARTLVPSRLGAEFRGFFLFDVYLLVDVFLVIEVRLNHFRMFFEIVVQRKARIVFKTFPRLRAGRFGLERHTGLEFIERIREARRLLGFGPWGDKLLRDWFRRWTGRGSRPKWNRLGGRRRRIFGFSRGSRCGLFGRCQTKDGEDARPLTLRLGGGRGWLRLGAGRRGRCWFRRGWRGGAIACCFRGASRGHFARGDSNLVKKRVPVSGLGRIGHGGREERVAVADENRSQTTYLSRFPVAWEVMVAKGFPRIQR